MTERNPLDQQFVSFSTMLTVKDLEIAEQFYVRHFGFRVTERLEKLRRLERPGVSIYLVTESPPTSDKPSQALPEHGLRFLTPPQQPPWGGWRCFAQDPDRYLIEIEQP